MIFSAKILKMTFRCVIAVVFFATAGNRYVVSAQSVWEKTTGYYLVRGMVTDSITAEPLPYASVTLAGASGGAVADAKGVFEFKVPATAKALHAAMVGYTSKTIPIKQRMTSGPAYSIMILFLMLTKPKNTRKSVTVPPTRWTASLLT